MMPLLETNIDCPLKIKNKRISIEKIDIYASCRHKDCNTKFHFVAKNKANLKFEIFSTSAPYDTKYHQNLLYRYTSGIKREQLGNEVAEHGAKLIQSKIIRSEDLSRVNYRNETIVASTEALRQMRTDKEHFRDFHENVSIDMLILKQHTDQLPPSETDETPSYIRQIRLDSFLVSWGCATQMRIFSRNSERLVYFDATGNMSRSPNAGRQFYYSLIFRDESSREIIPLLEFITDKHDIANISSSFNIYYRDLKLFLSQKNPIKVISILFII